MKLLLSRRVFVSSLTLGAAGITAGRVAPAEGLARLDVNEPAAVSLGYVESASQVDAKRFPAYVKGSSCDNCLQLQGHAGDAYRPCNLFAGKLVSDSGWCSGWTAEM